ncbi:MAG: iron-sulfur cluster carrier protein ApbC [Hyphomicrobiales bacterium]|nr:MAG: iron-sulfur cluster carrier protein ApbC [Hyphomicrobiales bacterium]
MSPSKEQVIDRLRRVKGPDLQSNIVDLGLVSEIAIKDGRVTFSITVPAARAQELEPLRQAAEKSVRELPGVSTVLAVLTAEAAQGKPPTRSQPGAVPESPRMQAARAKAAGGAPTPAAAHSHGPGKQQVQGIKHMVAVASGKGGVGKSTTAVNLALGFQALGLKVGVLDADIFGPSQPRLLGLSGRPEVADGNKLKPMQAFGLKAMSMGFLVDEGTPIIWRGPMVVSALTQMLRDVAWGDLDVLVIDMPPGTGDVQLTMAQQVPLSGAIIVSTPQDLALIDARKGLNMFRKVDVPVLGIIENMSMFICPKCGERSDIFGHGGAKAEAEKLGIPFLGGVPLHMDIRAKSDDGQPIVASAPDSPHAAIYRELAAKAWGELQGSNIKLEPPALEIGGDARALKVAFAGQKPFEVSAEVLRVMSPSAEVQGHSPSQRVTVARKKNVRIKELRPVGNYAVRIVFDDGHDTGLFTWSYLQTLHDEHDRRWSEYLSALAQKGLSRE